MQANSQNVQPLSQATDIRSALRDGIAQLDAHHISSAALAAELLLTHILGRDRTWLYTYPEYQLTPQQHDDYLARIARRANGVPVQHLTGHQEFWGLDFEVTPDVLIPRPETEHVIEVALERNGSASSTERRNIPFRIADVGTGSGCIAVALAYELPAARIVATDISAAALAVAKRNAARHGADQRIEFIECNLLDGPLTTLSGEDSEMEHVLFDLIVSNPPYIGLNEAATLQIEVGKFEPKQALFGGEIGTELYGPLIQQAAKVLKPGGVLVLELGHNSAAQVSQILNTPDWVDVVIANDLAGIKRVASAVRSDRR